MWTATDLSFKKFSSRRVTSSIKKWYEESGDSAIDIHATEVKYQAIALDNPAQAILDGVAEERNLFVLTLDNSVANNQTWFAAVGPTRLTNWISDKYGANYSIKLFDNTNNQIYTTNTIDWTFDYVTGVLMINGDVSAFPQPFKISGYRYIGQYLSDIVISAGSGHVILYNGTPLPQRTKLNFLGAILNVSDDSLNDQTLVNLSAIAAPGVSYAPTTPANWSFATPTPTNVQQALDSIANLLTLTMPAKAPVLTSQTLTFAGQTLFSGKIAAGLPSAWYTLFPAGTTINNVLYAGVFTLRFNGFRSGTANTPATYGSITANVNGSDVVTYAMTAGPGSNGIIQANNFQVHNSIWEKADGIINANQTAEGAATYVIKHTEAGNTNGFSVHLDDSSSAVTFPVGLTISVNTPVNKWLSGVSYLGLGTTLNVAFTIQNVFRKVYVSSGVAVLTLSGAPNTNFDPAIVPNFSDNFVVASSITLSVANSASLTPLATVTARKPNNLNAAVSNFNVASISNGISTYGTVSSTTNESFHDEARRLYNTTFTTFDSTAVLPSDEAIVVPGILRFKVGGSISQYYNRRFTKAAANNGNIIIGGITSVGQVSAYNTGTINILLKLETDNIWFDLGRPFGSNNGTGDGSSPANSIGARASFVSGNFGFSLGTYSTANNSNQYLFQIIIKSGAADLTSIATS